MKSQFGRSFLIFIFLLGGAKASARVFSFETENFAAVLEGTFGTTHLAQDGFAANKGGGVSLSENYNYTGFDQDFYKGGGSWLLNYEVKSKNAPILKRKETKV